MRYLRTNKGPALLFVLLAPAFCLDRTIMSRIASYYSLRYIAGYETVDHLMKFSTNGATLIILALMIFLAARKYNPKLSAAGHKVFVGIITAGIIAQIIKHLLGRARPRATSNMFNTVFIGPSLNIDYDSFPSGHTSVTFCLAFILSKYYPRYSLLFYLFAVVTGLDRIFGLSHFPSDVIAGAILGIMVGKAMWDYTPHWPAFMRTEKR